MKAKVLVGVISAILLTASVVVGFFQHSAYISQKSNQRGRRYSLSQVSLSAEPSSVDDLSSLLQTAKSEFGDAVTSPNAAAVMKDPVNNALKAAQATLQQTGPIVSVEDGKALSLTNYIKVSANGNAPAGPTVANWEATKANIELLKSNTVRLTGREPADFPGSDFLKFSVPDLPDIGSLDFASIQQYIENLSPVAKTWAAVATGTALIIIGASNNKKSKLKKTAAAVTSSGDIESTSAVIGGLTDELGTLQNRMKALEATGLDLDNQLNDAKTKLTRKELDISKAKLQAADSSLSLNREIDAMKQKLLVNDVKVKSMDDELNKARDECESLIKELEQSRDEQAKKAAAEAAVLAKKKAGEAAKKKKAVEAEKKEADEAAKKKNAVEAAKKKKAVEAEKKEADEAAKKKKAVEAEKKMEAVEAEKKEADEAAKKKKAVEAEKKKLAVEAEKKEAEKKQVAMKKQPLEATLKTAPKKAPSESKPEELPAVDTPVKKSAPRKANTKTSAPKKTAIKAKVEEIRSGSGTWTSAEELPTTTTRVKKAAPKKGDLTTLSKSALDRTTVKVLVGFLELKGITTVDESGKSLKKALLLEAVRSL